MRRYNQVIVAKHELPLIAAFRRMRRATPRNKRERVTVATVRKLLNAANRIERAERRRQYAEAMAVAP